MDALQQRYWKQVPCLGRTETKSATWCQYQTNQRIKSTARGRHQKGRTKDNHHQTASEEVLELVWPIPLRMNYDWTNLKPFHSSVLWTSFGKNWPSCFWGKRFSTVVNVFLLFRYHLSVKNYLCAHIKISQLTTNQWKKNGILAKHHLLRLNDKL